MVGRKAVNNEISLLRLALEEGHCQNATINCTASGKGEYFAARVAAFHLLGVLVVKRPEESKLELCTHTLSPEVMRAATCEASVLKSIVSAWALVLSERLTRTRGSDQPIFDHKLSRWPLSWSQLPSPQQENVWGPVKIAQFFQGVDPKSSSLGQLLDSINGAELAEMLFSEHVCFLFYDDIENVLWSVPTDLFPDGIVLSVNDCICGRVVRNAIARAKANANLKSFHVVNDLQNSRYWAKDRLFVDKGFKRTIRNLMVQIVWTNGSGSSVLGVLQATNRYEHTNSNIHTHHGRRHKSAGQPETRSFSTSNIITFSSSKSEGDTRRTSSTETPARSNPFALSSPGLRLGNKMASEYFFFKIIDL